jgi:hypothetical protein
MARRSWGTIGLGLLVGSSMAGCELQELTLAEPPVDVVVVEGLVQLGIPGGFSGRSIDRVSVLLHRTVQGADGLNEAVPGALVQVTGPDGAQFRLREMLDPSRCVSSTPLDGTGTCYLLGDDILLSIPSIRPGDALDLEVITLRGEVMRSSSVVPGDFGFLGPNNEETCVIPSDAPFALTWTEAPGAWAYVAETQIYGLRAALEPRGIEVEVDPLFLLGLSVSAADTVISFPAEFGVFDRFDLDRDVAVVLQQGLPPGTWAEVTVSAVDRNYVNWVRGGNFNPSGTVRIPSVTGDGTGYFGTSVTRWLEFLVNPAPQGGVYQARRCPGAGAT